MSLVVQKYGGSSVADAESILRVAARIARYAEAGHQVVVVVSAMGDTTDELIDLAEQVTADPPPRELDMLLTAGERISMAILSMALNSRGVSARAYTGSQAGLITDTSHGRAMILDVTPGRIRSAIDAGHVAIVAGFQGVSRSTKEITTLGRGGSDTTAVALAAALDADVCEIYTDVDGIFTADPRIVPSARRVPVVSSEEMLEMAANGAKVLMVRSVEYGRRYGVPLHVRSSFSGRIGTIVSEDPERVIPVDPELSVRIGDLAVPAPHPTTQAQESTVTPDVADEGLEAPIISGVAHDRSEGKITVVEVPDIPGKAARIFDIVAGTGANIDMIVQNTSTTDDTVAISLTLPEADATAALDALEAARDEVGFTALRYTDRIGKVSLVGAGMRQSPGVSARLFRALADAGINVDMISTSEIRISVVTDLERLDDAVRAIHTAFGLDADAVEAVVYGGTGR